MPWQIFVSLSPRFHLVHHMGALSAAHSVRMIFFSLKLYRLKVRMICFWTTIHYLIYVMILKFMDLHSTAHSFHFIFFSFEFSIFMDTCFRKVNFEFVILFVSFCFIFSLLHKQCQLFLSSSDNIHNVRAYQIIFCIYLMWILVFFSISSEWPFSIDYTVRNLVTFIASRNFVQLEMKSFVTTSCWLLFIFPVTFFRWIKYVIIIWYLDCAFELFCTVKCGR